MRNLPTVRVQKQQAHALNPCGNLVVWMYEFALAKEFCNWSHNQKSLTISNTYP